MHLFQIFSLILAVAVLKTEALPKPDQSKEAKNVIGSNSDKEIWNINEVTSNIDSGKNIVKRQVKPGPTGPGQYGGTWNSNNGKTQVKAGVDFNQAPKLGWHADAQHQIYKNPSGKVTVDAFAGANQQFNQIGKSHPNVHGGVRVNF